MLNLDEEFIAGVYSPFEEPSSKTLRGESST